MSTETEKETITTDTSGAKWEIRNLRNDRTASIYRHSEYAFSISPVGDSLGAEFLADANRGAETRILDSVLDRAVVEQSTRSDVQCAYGFTSDAIAMLTGREHSKDPRVAEAIEHLGKALRTISCKIMTDEVNKVIDRAQRIASELADLDDTPPQPIEEAIAEAKNTDKGREVC